ncbi:NAD(P)-dependent oxidoreductase [Enterococcus asini]|uniref:precorrin-2 dehydrogenase/sirohydrochlorin ferrochelatase family protein n=1 Tax=Enterococcus asini TaxID=57732 RepID=UPI00288EA74D|nr:NAD(P)-dependent oxidoreductase [Enterococcus asini]MDT2757899.1 NAD(P)-dependent oxidoreductase [Enterococcus asini]
MYPVLIDISKKKIVVVGAGKIATRKVLSILAGGGTATVIAPVASRQISDLALAEKITYLPRPYEKGDVAGFDFVFICSNQPEVNAQVLKDTKANQWVNDTTCKTNSNFYSPGVLQKDNFTYTVSNSDHDPKKTKAAKDALASWLAGESHD